MITQAVGHGESPLGRWSRTQLIAFRFAFVTTGLSLPHLSIFIPAYLFFDTLSRPVAAVIFPVANGAIRAAMFIGAFIIGGASGDRSPLQDLVSRYMQTLLVASYPKNTRLGALAEILGIATVSLLVTIVWSYADRRRANYDCLYRWMRVCARYTLALVAMVYAMAKVVPTQFGFLARVSSSVQWGSCRHPTCCGISWRRRLSTRSSPASSSFSVSACCSSAVRPPLAR